MRLELVCFFLFYISCALAENLEETDHEDLNPISQTEEDAEDSDQSKRFLFGDDSTKYALEKHVRFRGGQKQFLGYRPVKLQYLPVAQPLYNYKPRPMRVQGYNRQNLQQFRKPTVSLVPPKVNPLYKTLPANVPPSAPQKLSETQGWDVKPVYGPPGFIPSSPDPNPSIPPLEPSLPVNPIIPSTPVQPILPSPVQPVLPSPVQPVLPSPVQPLLPSPVLPHPIQPIIPTALPAHPHINVVPHSHPGITTVHFLPKPFVPLPVHPNLALPTHLPAPLPIPTPVLPAPQPSLIPLPTSVPIQPIHPPVLVQKPLVPINFIPGKHVPVPDLGVLPLGANVPVQVNSQSPHAVHKPVLIQHPQFIQRPLLIQHQQPHVHVVPKIPNVQLEGGFTPIQTNHPEPNHIHLHHFQPNYPQPIQPNVIHQVPSGVIPQPQLPIEPNTQPGYPNIQPGFHNIQPGFHNIQPGFQNIQPNFNNQQQEEPQQGYDEHPRFYQPGNTDLQIPEYLPPHPHLRNSPQQEEYQENYDQVKKR
nr:extensin-like [Onthophagus taurus]